MFIVIFVKVAPPTLNTLLTEALLGKGILNLLKTYTNHIIIEKNLLIFNYIFFSQIQKKKKYFEEGIQYFSIQNKTHLNCNQILAS